MPLTKQEKAASLEEVRKLAQTAKVVVLSDFRGIKVEDVTTLRRNVRKANGRFKVVKNTLSRKVFDRPEHESFRALMKGPTALAFGQDDPVELLKALAEFAKGNEKTFSLKAGLMDGQILKSQDLAVLATLPSKPVLMAQFLGWLNSPLSSLLGTMQAQVQQLLGVLKGIEEKAGGQGAPETPAS